MLVQQHTGFDRVVFSEETETDFIHLEEPNGWEIFSGGLSFADFDECDHDVTICGKRTGSEIIAKVTRLSDHSEEETEEQSTPPSFSDAISALATLKGHLCTQQRNEADVGCL
jgi:hypothetical protein